MEYCPELHKLELSRQNIMLMACTFVLLWMIFFLLYGLSFYFYLLCLCICVLCRRICIQTLPSARFQNVLNLSVLKMLTLICFPEVKAACLEFHIFPANIFASAFWPAGIYYKLQLHVLPFVIHQTRQTHWNIAVLLPAAWMRLTGTFLGLQ